MLPTQPVEIKVVGSSSFGRYPKISLEKTYNMFESDGWLVNYLGFSPAVEIINSGEGRGAFHSVRGNFVIAVISSGVYRINANLSVVFLGNIDTSTGEVYMDENLSQQICLVDGEDAYIYSYVTGNLTKQTLSLSGNTIIPNYVSYHNTFFLIASNPVSVNPHYWYAYDYSTDDTIVLNTQLSLQNKPDNAIAVKRLPGRGNNVAVFGESVVQIFTQIGGTINYRNVQSFNIDSGCVSVSTIAGSDDFIVWLSKNENNSVQIMVTDGRDAQAIADDGISYLLETISRPDKSTAFLYRQDGHLFYQITFFDDEDNVSLIIDFNKVSDPQNQTFPFYHVSDEDLNYHPARQVVYFNGISYFVSLNDGVFYKTTTSDTTYKYTTDPEDLGEEIPRIRITNTVRLPNNAIFRANDFTFWIEQGVTDTFLNKHLTVPPYLSGLNIPKVDLSISKNGNQSFGTIVPRYLNPQGVYRNQINWQKLGQANELTLQLRFWGFDRVVAGLGILTIY